MNNAAIRVSLLGLPGELRNKVYEYVAHQSTKIELHPGVIVSHALVRVCWTVRKEFLSITKDMPNQHLPHIELIQAYVRNFDFTGLEAQLSQLHRWGMSPHRGAVIIRFTISLIDLVALRKNRTRAAQWRETLIAKFQQDFVCRFKTRIDHEALGFEGVELLRELRRILDFGYLSVVSSSHLPEREIVGMNRVLE